MFIPLLLSLSAFAAEPTPNYECREWPDHTYYLYCGGAYLGHYAKALECIKGRKEICGTAAGDFECREWPDHTYYLYCGGAYVAHYDTALKCIQGKRATCD